ncbi:MAG: GPW/gp25 family protein [Bacteroidia bacterium]
MNTFINSIKYPFAVDRGLKTLAEENEYREHVIQLIKQVLLTSPGERINRPDFGCEIRRMLFNPNSEVSASLAQVSIFQALEKWLGTVISVEHVKVQPIEELLEIRVVFVIKALQERTYLNLEVSLS